MKREHDFFGGGAMGARVRSVDWSGTDLGPVQSWPASLRTAVGICLQSRCPMLILWGRTLAGIHNDACDALIGTEKPHSPGSRVEDAWPDLWRVLGPMAHETLSTGVATASEHELVGVRTAGVWAQGYVDIACSPIQEGDTVGGVFVVLTDRTRERTQAWTKPGPTPPLAGGSMLADVIEHMPVGVGVVDLQGRFILKNSQMQRLAGDVLPSFDTEASDRWRGLRPDGQRMERCDYPGQRALRGEEVRDADFIHRHADGREHWVRISAAPLRDPNGTVAGAVCIAQDIDGTRRAQETIASLALDRQQRAEELEAVLEALPVGVFLARNAACTDISMNEAGATLLRLSRAANASKTGPTAAALPFRVFQDGTEIVGDDLPMQRAAREGRTMGPLEVEVRFDDGAVSSLYEYAVPLFDPAGSVRGCVGVFVDITERRRAEEALQRSERFNAAVLDSLPAQIAVLDREARIVAVNEPWRRFAAGVGATPPARSGVGVDYLAVCQAAARDGEAAAEAALRGIADVLEGHRASFETEYACTFPGGVRWFSMHVVPASPEFGGAIVAHIDITERRRIGEELVRERELLKSIIDRIPVMVTMHHPDRKAVQLNPEFERVLGWTAEDATELSLLEQCYPDPWYRERVTAFMRSGTADWMDMRMRTRSGGYVHTSWANVRLSDRTRVGIGIDITERKRSELALRESEQRFRHIADSAPVLIWVADASGALFLNRAYLDFIGVDRAPGPDGGSWIDYVHPDDRDAYVRRYTECLESLTPFDAEVRLRRHDGEYRWMRSVGAARLTPADELAGYVGCTYDIHDARIATAALQEVDRRKDEFIATLAHELRNPLAPLRNSIHLLRSAGHAAVSTTALHEMMERQVNHMVRLVDDLLEISRITRGTFDLRRERVELAAVVRNAVETAQPRIHTARHELTVALPPRPLWLDGDPVRLGQILANLLNNAADYTDAGGRISITARRQGAMAVIAVRDNGAGIAADALTQVFEMFTRGDPFAPGTRGGLGIGLAIARRLAEMHGGTLQALSEGPGKGSEFVVRVPLAAGEVPEAVTETELEPSIRANRILVVDDNHDAADSLAMVLRTLGAEVSVAHSGREALDLYQLRDPAVVVLDIGMPDLDGYQVARALRERYPERRATLVALTGWGQEEHQRRAKEAGFDHHLVKPVDIAALQALLASLDVPLV